MTQNTVPATAPDPLAPTQPLEYSVSEPATRVRYGVLFFLCTLALLLYVDRICIGVAIPFIEKDLGLTKTQIAWVQNAFILAYCLFEVPTGHWGDRYGSRGVIARIVIWWSIFTALTGAAMGFWSLVLIRFLFGAGEAGAYPNTARVVPRWFPQSGRGLARGLITFISLLGGAIAPPLAAFLIGHVGWRATFSIFGSVGIAWAVVFYWWFRDDPADHRSVNDAERTLIAAGRTPDDVAAADGAHARIPWGTVLTSRNTWLLSVSMGVSAMCMYTQFQWFPTYLKEVWQTASMASGWMTGFVMAGGAVGCIAGGLLADFVTRLAGADAAKLNRLRRLSGGGSVFLAALSVFAVRSADSAVAVMLFNSAALFFVQAAIPTWWTVVAGISGRHGAAMWGLMNSMAAFGLLAITFLIGWWLDRGKAAGAVPLTVWTPIFNAVATCLLIGSACWIAMDTRKSIVARPDPRGFPLEV